MRGPKLARRRLRLMLEASGRPKLFDLLMEAVGEIAGDRFEIATPLAAGSQSYVFLAEDRTSGSLVVVKQPAFDYSRPLAHDRAQVALARARLRREHEILRSAPTHHLPRPIALSSGPPIVRSARSSSVLGGPEVFLVEEWIDGRTLDEHALDVWPSIAPADRERQAASVAREVIRFSDRLLERGWFYADINAANIVIEVGGGVRIVDAGSAVDREEEVVVEELTPAFTTPSIHRRFKAREPIRANLTSILPLLAKVLHSALTREQPIDGELPDVALLGANGHSYACTRAIEAMLLLDRDPSAIDHARRMLIEWDAWPS